MSAIAVSSSSAKRLTSLMPLRRQSHGRAKAAPQCESAPAKVGFNEEDNGGGLARSSAASFPPDPTADASTPVNRGGLSSLPPEVIHKILGYVFAMCRYTHGHKLYYLQKYLMIVYRSQKWFKLERKGQHELLNLLFVCRAWYHLAIKHLYEHPVLYTPKQLHAMVDRIRARPDLAKCVKTLKLPRYNSRWEKFGYPTFKRRLRSLNLRKQTERKAEPHADLRAVVALCPIATAILYPNDFPSRALFRSQLSSSLFSSASVDQAVCLTNLGCCGTLNPISDIVPSDSTFPALDYLTICQMTIPFSFIFPSSAKLTSLYLAKCTGRVHIPPPSALPVLHTVGLYFNFGEDFSSDIRETLLPHSKGLRELHLIGDREYEILLTLPLARFATLRVLAVGFPSEEQFIARRPMFPNGPLPPKLSWLICMTQLADRSREQQDMIAKVLDESPMDGFGLKGVHAVARAECPRGEEMVAFCERRGVRLSTSNLIPDECTLKQKRKGIGADANQLESLVWCYMNSKSFVDTDKQPWREAFDR